MPANPANHGTANAATATNFAPGFDPRKCPTHLADAIRRLVESGLLPGGFTRAVIANDLTAAAQHAADPSATAAIPHLSAVLQYCCPPPLSSPSRDALDNFVAKHPRGLGPGTFDPSGYLAGSTPPDAAGNLYASAASDLKFDAGVAAVLRMFRSMHAAVGGLDHLLSEPDKALADFVINEIATARLADTDQSVAAIEGVVGSFVPPAVLVAASYALRVGSSSHRGEDRLRLVAAAVDAADRYVRGLPDDQRAAMFPGFIAGVDAALAWARKPETAAASLRFGVAHDKNATIGQIVASMLGDLLTVLVARIITQQSEAAKSSAGNGGAP